MAVRVQASTLWAVYDEPASLEGPQVPSNRTRYRRLLRLQKAFQTFYEHQRNLQNFSNSVERSC